MSVGFKKSVLSRFVFQMNLRRKQEKQLAHASKDFPLEDLLLERECPSLFTVGKADVGQTFVLSKWWEPPLWSVTTADFWRALCCNVTSGFCLIPGTSSLCQLCHTPHSSVLSWGNSHCFIWILVNIASTASASKGCFGVAPSPAMSTAALHSVSFLKDQVSKRKARVCWTPLLAKGCQTCMRESQSSCWDFKVPKKSITTSHWNSLSS